MGNPNAELYVQRSLLAALRTALGTILLLEPGMSSEAPESAEEWARYFPLSIDPLRGRNELVDDAFLFQVNCVSRLAEKRADHQADAPWRISGIVRAVFENKNVGITAIGTPQPTFLGALKIGKAGQQYLDESLLAYAGEEGAPSPPTNIHAVALTFRAYFVVN